MGTTFSYAPTLPWATESLPPSPGTEDTTMYIRILHREMGFNATTWWLVDLHHEPPMEQGATPVVARCLRQYPSWDEAFARRVLRGYRQYLALATEAEDWRGSLLLPPPLVDQLWSLHIQDVATYCHDCMILCGHVLSRNIDSTNEEERRQLTLQKLALEFGNDYDPDIWSYGRGLAKATGNEESKLEEDSGKAAAADRKGMPEAHATPVPKVTDAAVNRDPALRPEGLANEAENPKADVDEGQVDAHRKVTFQHLRGDSMEDQSATRTLFPELEAQAATDTQNTDLTARETGEDNAKDQHPSQTQPKANNQNQIQPRDGANPTSEDQSAQSASLQEQRLSSTSEASRSGARAQKHLRIRSKRKASKGNQVPKALKQLKLTIPMLSYSKPRNSRRRGGAERKVNYSKPVNRRRYSMRDLDKANTDFRYSP